LNGRGSTRANGGVGLRKLYGFNVPSGWGRVICTMAPSVGVSIGFGRCA
jgi:hypothetical protein